MEPWTIVFVCVAGFFANFIGVLTGGSGILTTALMIGVGLGEHHAVANTRFSVIGTDVTSTIAFHRADKIAYRLAFPLAAVSGLSALAAAQTLEFLSREQLRLIIGSAMLLLVVVTLAFPRVGTRVGEVRGGAWIWTAGVALIALATALTTVAGGAAGALFSYILVLVFGQSFLNSAGTRKIMAMALTLAAAPTFALRGLVDYEVAIPLTFANALGGWLGARFMIRRGDRVVRWIFLAGVTAIAIWLVVSTLLPGR